jgi:hypothetical protein
LAEALLDFQTLADLTQWLRGAGIMQLGFAVAAFSNFCRHLSPGRSSAMVAVWIPRENSRLN